MPASQNLTCDSESFSKNINKCFACAARVQAFLQAHVTALLQWMCPLIILLFLMLMLFTPIMSLLFRQEEFTAFTFELPLQWDMKRADTLRKSWKCSHGRRTLAFNDINTVNTVHVGGKINKSKVSIFARWFEVKYGLHLFRVITAKACFTTSPIRYMP